MDISGGKFKRILGQRDYLQKGQFSKFVLGFFTAQLSRINGSRCSRMDQIKFAEDSLYKIQSDSDMFCQSRSYHFKFFKGCLPQILLGPFLNTSTKCYSLLVTTRQPCPNNQHLVRCYTQLWKWCWNTGIYFALMFLLGFFQLTDLVLIIDNTTSKGGFAINFYEPVRVHFHSVIRFFNIPAACVTK